jgi:hypothetical protein
MTSRPSLDHEPKKKKAHVSPIAIFSFFSSASKFQRDVVTKMGLMEDLLLFVVKGLLPMRIIEFMSYLPSKKMFVEDILPSLVEKTTITYV